MLRPASKHSQRAMVFVCCLLIAAGCASARGGADSTRSSGVRVTPHSGPEATSAPPSLGFGTPSQTTAGKVTVTLDRPAYTVGQTLGATVANGLEAAIYSADSKSDCSIVTLERRDGTAWQSIQGCSLGRVPLVMPIGPGRARRVSVNPRSVHFGVTTSTPDPAFGVGTYRVKFSYGLVPGQEVEESKVVYSPEFSIGG